MQKFILLINVFQKKDGSEEIDLLIVAGGGGGLAHRNTNNDGHQLNPARHNVNNPGDGYNGYTNPNGAGKSRPTSTEL